MPTPTPEAHLEAARRLLVGRRPGGPTGDTRPPLRTRFGRAVDALVMRGMQQIFVASHRRGVQRARGVDRMGGSWRELAELAARDPGSVFPAPRPPAELHAERRRRVEGGVVEDLRFPSAYAPGRRSAQDLLQRYPTNATAHARHYRHDGSGHPALLWLHGWGMGHPRLEARLFGLRRLFELGLDIYLYVQPYHAARLPDGVRFGGTMHPSTRVTRTNEAFVQTAWEVRALAARHSQLSGGGPCGVMGWSLGGYAAALLASLAPELAFSIPVVPIADVPALLWSWGRGTRDRARAEAAGVTFDAFCRSMALHAPLARPLVLPRERVLLIGGRGDRIIPPIHTEVLHEHWGRPESHWFDGSHIVHFGRRGYLARVKAFLRGLALV